MLASSPVGLITTIVTDITEERCDLSFAPKAD